MNSRNNEPTRNAAQGNAQTQLLPVVEFKDLTNGQDPVVMIRLEDGSLYRLQKTKFGKLLLSK